MNFTVSFGRTQYIANVKKFATEMKPGDIPNYFETKWEIDLFADNNHIGTFYCNTQYDENPSILDITNSISNYYNRFCLYFAKYGTAE